MKRVLTGLQPSGNLTLGNYIGAIKQMVNYQDEYDSYLFVADLHALTVEQNPEELHHNIRNLIALYLACGVDPKKNTIYIQSDNIYHTYISWLLECTTPYGELTRMTQFKDKSSKHIGFSVGLLTYPVLMAADIIIYDADYVPVGKDQKQHVELARNVAEKVNKRFGKEVFKLPDTLFSTGEKIMDLQNPTKKMSKSEENQKGVIYLMDSEADIRKKIMSATTDSEMCIKYDPENKPGISNLMTIYSSLANMDMKSIEDKYQDTNYGTFKKDLAEIVINTLKPIQEKYNNLINSDLIDKVLDDGMQKTTEIAKKKYNELRKLMGVYR